MALRNDDQERLRQRMRDVYDIPVSFWRDFLGVDLHFHLGHFSPSSTTLDDSVRLAVHNLTRLSPHLTNRRVLDVGCGWGGPAFELFRTGYAKEIMALTNSREQAYFINNRARLANVPLYVKIVDVETDSLLKCGLFEVFWLCE